MHLLADASRAFLQAKKSRWAITKPAFFINKNKTKMVGSIFVTDGLRNLKTFEWTSICALHIIQIKFDLHKPARWPRWLSSLKLVGQRSRLRNLCSWVEVILHRLFPRFHKAKYPVTGPWRFIVIALDVKILSQATHSRGNLHITPNTCRCP